MFTVKMVRIQHFLMLIYVVCLKGVYGIVVITSINNIEGLFVFLEGSRGSLLCSINPCQGQVHWIFDSEEVAECINSLCTQFVTRSGTYYYGFNTRDCIFEFGFNPVTRDLRDKIIECKDGETSANVTLEVQEVHTEESVFGDQSHIWHGLGAIAFFLDVIAICFALVLVRKQIVRCLIKRWHEGKEGKQEGVKKHDDENRKKLVELPV